jgi:hypothetical protein
MQIKDLFSHKIHSGEEAWQDKLIELASIFSEFDGHPYNRDRIEDRLKEISPRSSFVARDASKFRDEYSAYPAYFGLYRLELENEVWTIKLSDTTKKFLLNEEPDVGSFLRIQMTLFQYPNGMGVAYYAGTNRLRLQANTRDRTLDFIHEGVHLSPLRLIVSALIADAQIKDVSYFEAHILYKEIFALANDSSINNFSQPPIDNIIHSLIRIRKGKLKPPERFESRFHLLNHLEIFELLKHGIRFRQPEDNLDSDDIMSKIESILKINTSFTEFDQVSNAEELLEVIKIGSWQKYFDGVNTLNSEQILLLGSDVIEKKIRRVIQKTIPALPASSTYKLKNRAERTSIPKTVSRKSELADPEVTKIKRQRRHLSHKILVDNMHQKLKRLGAKPLENPHIDLFAKIPNDGSFLFEMKSRGENILSQVRKGISQLYEYRYRYKNQFEKEVHLCLVLEGPINEIPWLEDYICDDRKINLCWFNEDGAIEYPKKCHEVMKKLSC